MHELPEMMEREKERERERERKWTSRQGAKEQRTNGKPSGMTKRSMQYPHQLRERNKIEEGKNKGKRSYRPQRNENAVSPDLALSHLE